MNVPNANLIYRLSPAVAIEDFGDRSLALHCTGIQLVELNETAREIVGELDGRSDLRTVALSIASQYNIPWETALQDVQTITDQMSELGIVELVSAQESAP